MSISIVACATTTSFEAIMLWRRFIVVLEMSMAHFVLSSDLFQQKQIGKFVIRGWLILFLVLFVRRKLFFVFRKLCRPTVC